MAVTRQRRAGQGASVPSVGARFRDETYATTDIYNETGKSREWAKAVETSRGSAFQLVLEVGDAHVGGGEFAGAVQQLLLQDRQAVAGVAQCADLLAQRVDLAGPAGLVRFLAVLGEFGALQGRGEFGGLVGSGGGRCAGLAVRRRRRVEQAIDAADAAGGAVAGLSSSRSVVPVSTACCARSSVDQVRIAASGSGEGGPCAAV